MHTFLRRLGISMVTVLAACSVDGADPDQAVITDTDGAELSASHGDPLAASSATIGGTVTDLAGSGLVIRNNGGDALAISGNGSFTFATPVASGATFAVTVSTQPVPQTCTVSGGNGTVGSGDVTSVVINCARDRRTIGGTISGLAGAVTLQNNGGNEVVVTSNGSFAFSTTLPSSATYNVTVGAQPAGQVCTVSAGSGTVGTSNVTNVQVACANQPVWSPSLFPIAVPGSSFGLGDLAFDNNGDLLVAVSGSASDAIVRVNRFTGAQTTVASNVGTGPLLGIAYRAANDMIYVTTSTQIFAVTPTGQVSVLATSTAIAFEGIAIAPPSFGSFGGFIIASGRNGSLVAVNPASGAITTITSSAAGSDLAFAPDGTLYVCFAGAIRTVTAAGVVTVFATGFGSADGIAITADGARMFIADSGTDTVRQVTIPGGVVTTVAAADIDDGTGPGGILVAPGNTLIVMTGESSLTLRAFPIAAGAFTIGGTVSGLTGAGLVLQNNGGDDRAISGNGAFTFATPVASGAAYNVTIRTQPAGQVCTVSAGSGTVGSSNVTNVQVACAGQPVWSPSLFPIAVPGTSFGLGDVAFDNNGDLLVSVSGGASNAIVRVNRFTGAQTTIASNVGTGLLLGIAYRAANDMIYATTETQIFAVTPTGQVSVLATSTISFEGITIAPPSFGNFGGFIIASGRNGSLVAVNPASGVVTTITDAAPGSDLAFAPDGTLYVCFLGIISTVSATGTVAVFATGFGAADGIAITADGTRMFVADSGTDTVRQVTIPGGVVTTVAAADIDDGTGPGGIIVAPGNTLIVMTGENSLTLRAFSL
jgi:sugar lactone lactonase YvrE